MSDWTTDIDHPMYKETRRKFQAEEPLTAIEALVAFNEFRGGLGDDGYSEMEIERHLQEHVGRVAELEGVNEALSEELVAQAAEAGALSTAEGLVAGLQAQLESSRAEVERLKLEAARRELDDAVLAAAHEMLERLGLDPNGTELADMDDERKEGE